MLFVLHIDINHKTMTQAIKCLKNPVIPEGVKIIESLWLFGKPDAMLIFEAENESLAGQFVIQFAPVGDTKTSMVFPIQQLSWTQLG